MALDAAAAAIVADQIATALGFTGAAKAAQVVVYTVIVQSIFDGIIANAIVLPTGVPPFSNSGGPVVGTGKVT